MLREVTFAFDPKHYSGEIRTVGIMGNFLFYHSNLTGHTCETGMGEGKTEYMPEDYEEGMAAIGSRHYREMPYNEEKGVYEITWKLPEGLYFYRFVINADIMEVPAQMPGPLMNARCVDGKVHGFRTSTVYIKDPTVPEERTTTSGQSLDAVRFIGTSDEMPWLPGTPKEKQGTLSYMSYRDIDDVVRNLGVYLPAGYDRTKEYPVVWVTHGGGGCESSWWHYGGLKNILDCLMSQGRTKEAIVVTMNNSVYKWDYKKIADNLYEKIMPFIRMIFPVSCERDQNAFCGFSMGGMTTSYMYMHRNDAFRYFGIFSGTIGQGSELHSLEDPDLPMLKLMIGCAEEDIAWNPTWRGLPAMLTALREKEMPHYEYFTVSGHDWYCWSMMYTEFAEHVLWK